jgi:hypothetical protein
LPRRRLITHRRAHGIIVAFGFLVAALLLAIDALSPADRPVFKVSGTDAVGYFATAHSLLFDFDFDLTNEYAFLRPRESSYAAIRAETGRPGSPWPIGYSLLQVPFLALGTFVDYLGQNPADGYSRYALTFYYLGNVAFMTIGLVCLFQFLYAFTGRELPTVSETRRLWSSLVVTLLLWPSTTLGYYTFSSMSHVAGFMTVTLMVLVWWHVKDRDRPWEWVLLGVAGGLTILCRWQNALLLLWPLLYDLWEWRASASPRRSLNWPWLRARLLFASAAAACLIPQFIQWKVIYGSYVTNPHGADFVQFPPWFVPNVLLSTRHGWFTWTPVVAVCVLGLLYGCYRAPRVFIPLTTVLFLEVAVMGSLPTVWHVGEAFGMRTLTCTLGIAALGLAWLALHASPRKLVSLGVVVAACTLYTVVFAVQYRMDLLPKQDWLTSEELVRDKIFLRQAYERQKQVRLANALLREGRSAPAIAVLETAERRYGDSRFLLEILTEAYAATGRTEEAGRVQQRLQALLDRRLY